MSNKPSATFTIDCAGCHKSITHSYDGTWNFEFRIEQLISKDGWIRRDFSPNVGVWFCGHQCAMHSYAAKQCEEWWERHNREKELPPYKAVIYTVLTMAATIAAALVFNI